MTFTTFTEGLIAFCKEEIGKYKVELLSANSEDVYKIERKMNIMRETIVLSNDYEYNDNSKFSFNEIEKMVRGIRGVKQSQTIDIMQTKIHIFTDDIVFFSNL
jgi:cystathionine beta-lyase family protein involved in aluminum resistance